jgi:hypothetical protein
MQTIAISSKNVTEYRYNYLAKNLLMLSLVTFFKNVTDYFSNYKFL